MSNFLQQVEREIKRLKREMGFYERRIKALEIVREEYIKDETSSPKRTKAENGSPGRVDKIVRVMKNSGKPLHYLEIVDLLEKEESEGLDGVKDKGATITATLSLHRDVFKRVGKGTYALMEESEKENNKPDEPL